jgi:DNA-binding MarR family transcriptional regulator
MAKKKSGAASIVLRPGFLLHDVARLRRTVLDQKLKPLGITRSQMWVITNLSRHGGEGFSQIELARLLDIGKGTLGGLIDRLEARGFVERIPDKIDRRAKRVRMSDAGKVVFYQMRAVAERVNADVMRSIPRKKQEIFIEVLAQMKHNLISMDAVPSSTTIGSPLAAAERKRAHSGAAEVDLA